MSQLDSTAQADYVLRLNEMFPDKKRGGSRAGAGRKAGEPTQVIRVPVSLVDEILALVSAHKAKVKL